MRTQGQKRRFIGVVKSDAMTHTRVVSVTGLKKHPKYMRYYSTTRNFKVHDEKNEYKKGDKVLIEETRPRSREKRWRIVEKIVS